MTQVWPFFASLYICIYYFFLGKREIRFRKISAMQESPMVLYCDFESSQTNINGTAEHKVTGFCIKPVTRFGLPTLSTITYAGTDAIQIFFKEIKKFSYHMQSFYHRYGKKEMLLDKKSPEYKAHFRKKKCWICKEEISCTMSMKEFVRMKYDSLAEAGDSCDEDQDDTGESIGPRKKEDEIWMRGPKVNIVKIE